MRGAATDLPAGRELDALVAEKMMGYVWRKSNRSGKRCICRPDRCPDWFDSPADGTEPLVSDWDSYPFTPAYSTDIAAAWEVVERLLVRRMYPDLVSSNYPVVWTCEVDSYSDPEAATDPWPVKSCADTAPLAICRAALQAVRARADSEPTP